MFRDDIARCLDCDGPFDQIGDRRVCNGCGAVLMDAKRFDALMLECAPDDDRSFQQRVFTSTNPGRSCPLCREAMVHGAIHGIELEHCREHGVLLGSERLAKLLGEHASLYQDRTDERTPIYALLPFGPAVNEAILPWAKRRRMRKYLARTTPPKRT
jgi:hypothetical protein